MRTLIIAEAGVNHNGDLGNALRLVEIASDAGADLVKFQTFTPENVVTKYAPKAQYQIQNTNDSGTQLSMIRKLQLSFNEHKKLINHCKKNKIGFFSTPFDIESIRMLSTLGLKHFKIPSGEITNLPYLRHIGSYNYNIIMSTGMAEIHEIKEAIKILTVSGTKKNKIIVLHCTSEYPTKLEDVNLRAMKTIEQECKVRVGYSDHTLGIEVPLAAVSMGAFAIEKHFTIDRNMKGPDHRASLEPNELKLMVNSIRKVEKCLGSSNKVPTKKELETRIISRKSIVASMKISKGEEFTEKNLTTKRPGNGISPMNWDKVIGKKSKKNFLEDELIDL